jgi:hypothetical protein
MAEKKGVVVAGKDARKRSANKVNKQDAKEPGPKSPTKKAKLVAAN